MHLSTSSDRSELSHPGAHPTRLRGVGLFAAMSAITLLGVFWPDLSVLLGLDLNSTQEGRLLCVVHALVAAVAAALLCSAAASMSGRSRVAWSCIAAGSALLAAGDVVWIAMSFLGSGRSTEMTWYLVLTPALVAIAVGTTLIPSPTTRVQARIRRLDVAIVVLALFTLIWARPAQAVVQLVGDSFRHVSSSQVGVLSGSSLLGVLVVLIAGAAVTRVQPDPRGAVHTAAAALIAVGIGQLLLAVDPIDSSEVGALSGALPLVSVALLVVTARRLRGPLPETGERVAEPFTHRPALPELATLLAIGAVALRQYSGDTLNVAGLVLGAAIVALSITRLGRLEYEQRRLTRSLRTSAERLFHDARVDSLTGLGNRMALDEELTEQLSRAELARDNGGLSVFYIDVDHFKRINDALGHHVGDALLTETAERLRVVFGERVYRVGGDEFVAVRPHTEPATAEATAAAAIEAFSRSVDVEGHELAVSASIGLAHHSVEPPDRDARTARAESLLRRADLALYRAKELGRNRWESYDPVLQRRADHHLAVQEALSRAVDEQQMHVYAQPVAELATGRWVGAQVRLRWRSPAYGLLGPDDFLHDAIEGGMLQSLDALLLTSIGHLLPHLGAHDQPLEWISTTMSRQEILYPGLVDLVDASLGSDPVQRGRLRIEVNEDTVVDDAARTVLDALRELGVRITVARFGTGPSSMLRLSRYPASAIKIDPSFTAGIGRRHEDTVIVTSVAGLGADLGLELAADGVDEEFQARMLADRGFTLGEGRLYGEAVPIQEFLGRAGQTVADEMVGHRR